MGNASRLAIGMVELNSIARGIETCDYMVKAAQVDLIRSSTVCPGKYMVLIAGDTGDGNLCSLTQEQLKHFSQRFAQPETFQPGEVEDALRFFFYSM